MYVRNHARPEYGLDPLRRETAEENAAIPDALSAPRIPT